MVEQHCYILARDKRVRGTWFDTQPGPAHTFVEIDHEIFSTVILLLQLIQEDRKHGP